MERFTQRAESGNELFKPIRKNKEYKRFENIKYSDATLMGWTKNELIEYINYLYEKTDRNNIIDEFAENIRPIMSEFTRTKNPHAFIDVTRIAEQMKGV